MMRQKWLSRTWEASPTGQVIYQLNRARFYFNRHPLYQRWIKESFEARAATWAQEVPDFLLNYIPMTLLIAPFIPLGGVIFFGVSVFTTIIGLMVLIFLVGSLLFASIGNLLTAGLTASTLSHERQSGRWELLMLLPHDRVAILAMRISSRLVPYQAVIGMINLIQSLCTFIVAGALTAGAASMTDNTTAICLLWLLPTLFLLSWERRQDYAFSVTAGLFGVMRQAGQDSWGVAFIIPTLILIGRGLMGLLGVALAANVHGFWAVFPTILGGPAMLPVMGVPMPLAIALLSAYYGLREVVIWQLWQMSLERITA